MVFKSLQILAIILVLFNQKKAYAQLEERLQSRAIKDYLVLTVEVPTGEAKKQLAYATNATKKINDGLNATKPITEKTILRSDEEFAVVVPFSNPLKYEVALNITTEPDPQNEYVTKLFTESTSLYKLLSTQPGTQPKTGFSITGSAAFTNLLPKIKSTQLLSILQAVISQKCSPGLEDKLVVHMAIMEEGPSKFSTTAEKVLQRLTTSDKREELISEYATASKEIIDLKKNIDDMNAALTELKSGIASIPEDAATSAECKLTKALATAHTEEYGVRLQEQNKIRTTLATRLEELIKKLEIHLKPENVLFKIVDKEYVLIQRIKVGAGEQVTVEIKKTDLIYSIKEGKVDLTTNETHSGKIIIYRKGVAFDFSTGAVLTNLEFTSYGTTLDAAGQTVVAEPTLKRADVLLPAMLNVYPYFNIAQLAPFLQIGVSPTRERPALLGGIGFRLLGVKHIAFSVGGVTSWQPELDGLKPMDPVSGTAEIEQKTIFKLSSKLKGYVGINYAF